MVLKGTIGGAWGRKNPYKIPRKVKISCLFTENNSNENKR